MTVDLFSQTQENGGSSVIAPSLTNESLCGECGGKCCRRSAGLYHPSQINWSNMCLVAAALRLGLLTVDQWEGDPRDGHDELGHVAFVRPSHVNDRPIRSLSWGGRCSWHADDGCTIPRGRRPAECELLAALPDGKCRSLLWKKRTLAIEWIPFQSQVEQAMQLAEDTQ